MRKINTVFIGVAFIAALLTVTACKALFSDIEEDFSYWASEPIITGFRTASAVQPSDEGFQCVPSEKDAEITLTVRNPKKFSFIMPGSAGAPTDIVTFASGVSASQGVDYTLEQTSLDTLKLTYKAAFLKRYEWSSANIGAAIQLYSTDGRKFNQNYKFDLEANTPPPSPVHIEASSDNKIALFKTATADLLGKQYYVLCFKVDGLPGENVLSGVPLHGDIKSVFVSKNDGEETSYSVTINSGYTDFDVSRSGGVFIAETDVAQLSSAETAAFLGSPAPDAVPSGPWVLYLKTDIPVGGAAAKYGIRLFDGKLYSAQATQTIGKRPLPTPKVFAHADIDNVAVFGVYTEGSSIAVPGTAAKVNSDDLNGSGANNGSTATNAIPVYSAYGEDVKLTIKKDSLNDYPAGVTVTGSAEYVSGASASTTASFTAGQSSVVTLPSPIEAGGETVYKVVFKASGTGFDDSGERTLYYKVRRELKAVNNLPVWYMLGAAIKRIPLGGAGTVKISGILKAKNIGYPPLPDGTPVENHTDIGVSGEKDSGDYPGRTVTVIGDNKASSILDANNLCSVFTIEFNGKLILKNVTLQNAKNDSGGYGGGIDIGDNGSSLVMTDTDIKNCTVTAIPRLGGAVYVREGGSLTVGSGCVISNNTASGGNGDGIYVQSGAAFNISGDAKIDENNDVYLKKNEDSPYDPSKNAKITVTGALTGTHVVAKITPEDYTAGIAVVNAASGVTLSAADAARFKITDQTIVSPPSTVLWKLIRKSDNTLVLKPDVPITVNGTNPNAWKTLKEAIEAESVEDGDEFVIKGPIKATNAPGNSGAITVRKKITVKSGNTTPVLNANSNHTGTPPTNAPLAPHRIFTVESGAELTLDDIQLENGNAGAENGGAILINAGGAANIKNTHIYGCEATKGGAIYNEGSLSLSLCHIGAIGKPNKAKFGGGIYSYYNTYGFENCTIMSTDICYNEADKEGGGILIVKGKCIIGSENAVPTLIDHNMCSGSSATGGGISIGISGFCTISGGTKISNNSCVNGSGGGICNSGILNMEGSSSKKVEIVSNNGELGGGIYQAISMLKTQHTEIKKNSAKNGGGIYVAGGRCILQDGTILGDGGDDNVVNGNGSGGGVYVAGGAFVMESDARIVPSTGIDANTPGKNDVYLRQNEYITLKDVLTGTAPVARITPSQYIAGRAVVKGDGYTLTASDANRFAVTPEKKVDGVVYEWVLVPVSQNSCELKKVSAVITTSSTKQWQKLKTEAEKTNGPDVIIIDGEILATKGSGDYGEITIARNLTIKGKNSVNTDKINANKNSFGKQGHRIFNVPSGKTLKLENITLKGGMAPTGENGGGIYLSGNASCTLDSVIMQGNTVNNGKGSAVYVAKENGKTPTLTLKGDVQIGDNTPNSNTICLGHAVIGSTIQTAFISAKSDDLSGTPYINIEPEDYIKQSNLDLVKGDGIGWKDGLFHLTNEPTSKGSWKLTKMLGGIPNFNRLALERTSAELSAPTTGSWKALKEAIQSVASGGTLTLNGLFKATSGDDSGEIILRKVLTIKGNSSAAIDADNRCRIFKVEGGMLTLKDITLINGNAAGSNGSEGGGVYVSTGQFAMKGSTRIVPSASADAGKNDVYLKDGRMIDIEGILSGTHPVARITPEDYREGTQVLSGGITITDGTMQNYRKFTVTPQSSLFPNWYVDSDGKLFK